MKVCCIQLTSVEGCILRYTQKMRVCCSQLTSVGVLQTVKSQEPLGGVAFILSPVLSAWLTLLVMQPITLLLDYIALHCDLGKG